MLVWMLYAVAVATLVGVAALALERAARLKGRSARGLWTAAIAVSLAVPAATWVWAGRDGPAAAATDVGPAAVLDAAALDAAEPLFTLPDLSRLDGPARTAWGVSAALLALLLAGSAFRLGRSRRRWRRAVVADSVVRVSPDLGPAVVGLLEPEVVLPGWVLAADEEARRWIVRHEREHVAARDPLRLAAGLLPVLLLPWNLPLWWQLRRLRQAVEIDCDDRVLADADSAARCRYGRLLLEVGRRTGPSFPLLAAFAETPSFLERRIRAMSRGALPVPPGRVAALGLGAVVLLAGACLVPGPDRQSITGPEVTEFTEVADAEPVEALPGDGRTLTDRPTFTPYTRAPALLNESEVRAALARAYPPLLRDAGIGGRVQVYFFIDEGGRVTDTRVHRSSGHGQLDDAALRVAGAMRFSPALNRDQRVPVWISLPITFRPAGASDAGADRTPGEPVAEPPPGPPSARARDRSGGALSDGPTFTPYTVAPALTNEAEVQRALEREYPPLLRDAGIGGKAIVYLLVDRTGGVQDARLNETSGHRELDRAAVRVARAMEFRPARNRDEAVAVWISLPVSFHVR